MRNVIFAINITLDGCCDHTKQVADDESHEYFTHLLREVDLLVFGRITYQLMVPFWPEVAKNQSMTKASNEFARTFDSIEKIVFSRSLDGAEDKNTRIVRTKLRDEILRLKQEPGKNILVGGVDFPSQLMEHWLSTPEVLQRFALHYQTGKPIPQALVDKINRTRTFNQGFATVEYLAAAILDMKLHLLGDQKIDARAFASSYFVFA